MTGCVCAVSAIYDQPRKRRVQLAAVHAHLADLCGDGSASVAGSTSRQRAGTTPVQVVCTGRRSTLVRTAAGPWTSGRQCACRAGGRSIPARPRLHGRAVEQRRTSHVATCEFCSPTIRGQIEMAMCLSTRSSWRRCSAGTCCQAKTCTTRTGLGTTIDQATWSCGSSSNLRVSAHPTCLRGRKRSSIGMSRSGQSLRRHQTGGVVRSRLGVEVPT